jgi:putative membrane protein
VIQNSWLNFAAYFALCLALWASVLRLYVAATPYREFALVGQGNVAAALSLAGTALGLALPLASLAAHAVSIADLLVWALVALAAQVVLWVVLRRLLFKDLKEAIESDRASVGGLLGALALGLGLINAACLTY